ncbi:MAG: D-glycero-beta-D-manno-heptose-7-phosphate kinase [Candidatus Poribacteria bacterium]|nr:D-glycero-beta-D-manno-heptose-7-phosphate kinase [Candidatus Poribacteria bacterium]
MNLKTLFTQLQGKRVMIIGDIIVDEYIWGDVTRISPEAPVPVFETSTETSSCGGAANVAQNVASLGGDAALVGVIGSDRTGEKLIQMATEMNLGIAGVCIDSERPTSTKTRVIARAATSTFAEGKQEPGQHLLRIDRESKQKISTRLSEHLLAEVGSQLPASDAVVFADYDKGVVNAQLIKEVVKQAQFYNVPVVVDPKRDNFWYYEGVTALTPNHKEASAAVHEEITEIADLITVGEKILDQLSLGALLITRDADGMSLFQRETDGSLQVKHLPPYSSVVTDVTGAGDTVVAVFTLALAAGAEFHRAAVLSSLASGIVVGKMGCATVTSEELHQAISEFHSCVVPLM